MDNCGIDLHLKSSEVCVVDEVGEIGERVQIPTTERSLVRWFGNRPAMRICIEASGLSPWVARVLRRLGHQVVVAIGTRSGIVDKLGIAPLMSQFRLSSASTASASCMRP